MGKNKAPETVKASFSPSKTIQYGEVTSKSYKDPVTGEIINEMIETPSQKATREQNEARMNTINARIGDIYDESSPLYQGYRDEAKSTVDRLRNDYYDSYNPLYKSTRNDIYSRLGTLNTSQTGDILAPLEKQRAQQEQAFAKELTYMPRQLADAEASRLMALGGYYEALDQNAFNKSMANFELSRGGSELGTNLSLQNAQMANQMAMQKYLTKQAQLQAMNQAMKTTGSMAGGFM